MAERREGRPWSAHEDQLLIQAVAIHGEVDNWKTVALSVPGRTNKACRKRWLHSLSPNVKKSAWTREEDELLLQLYAKHGTKWSLIARQIPGRTDDACSKRYREALDPSLKKDEWTPEEDHRLCRLYDSLGGKWGQIGQQLSRSGLGCRNRWRLLSRKQTKPPLPDFMGDVPVSHPIQGPSNLSSVPSAPASWPPVTANMPSNPYWPSFSQPSEDDHGYAEPNLPPPPFQYSSSSLRTALSPVQDGLSENNRGAIPLDPALQNTDIFGPQSNNMAHASSLGNEQPSCFTQDAYLPSMPPESEEHMHVDGGSTATKHGHTTDINPEEQNLPSSQDAYSPRTSHSPALETEHMLEDESQAREQDLSTSQPETRSPQDGTEPVTQDLTAVPSNPHPPKPSAQPEDSYTTLRYYRSPLVPRPRKRKQPSGSDKQYRLNSELPASSDPSVKPYACGHSSCWPVNASTSLTCFATSQELTYHWKTMHAILNLIIADKPFRCGLEGCGKGWKSMNGLQYHLQISKAHFIQALASPVPSPGSDPRSPVPAEVAQPESTQGRQLDENPELITSPNSSKPKRRKTHGCPHPGCPKTYKQLSGLRYHLQHSHEHHLPAQLTDVPPTLARKIQKRESKANAKASTRTNNLRTSSMETESLEQPRDGTAS